MAVSRLAPPGIPLVLSLCSVLGFGGCGDKTDSVGSVLVHDSAGVVIVENGGNVWAAPRARELSREPVVHIGAVEGDEPYLFSQIGGIVCLSDGRIVVTNGDTNTLRWFDAEGTFLFERGGSGEGPGEFSRLGSLTGTSGDSVVAVDWAGRRAVTLGPDGGLGSTTLLSVLPGPPGEVFRLGDGSYVTSVSGFSSTQLPPDQQAGIFRVAMPLIHLSAGATGADTLGMFPGMEVWLRQMGGGMGFGPPPFARNLHYTVAGNRVFVGIADPFQVDVFSAEGRWLRSIRAPDMDLRLTDAERDAYRERSRARIPQLPEEQQAEAQRSIQDIRFPEARPAYGKILVDQGGSLWVSRYSMDSAEEGIWARFDPEGRLQEVLTTPPGFVPFQIRDDRIWGRTTDDLGVQYVDAYSLEPVSGAG